MDNINLELYRTFIVVADNNNITRASELLYISQPAVTKQINLLENELNKKLFNRTKNGTFLTEDGKKLYKEIKEPINKLINISNIYNYDNKIELGIHINFPKAIYKNMINEYYKTNDSTIINVNLLPAEDLFEKLENQELDLIISKKYDESIYNKDKLEFLELGYFKDAFIVRNDSKYSNLSKEDLKKEEIYTLKKFSKTYQNLIETLNYQKDENNIKNVTYTGIIDLLYSRDIIAFLPIEYIKDHLQDNSLKVLDIETNYYKEPFGIYYNTNNKNTKTKNMIDILKVYYNL